MTILLLALNTLLLVILLAFQIALAAAVGRMLEAVNSAPEPPPPPKIEEDESIV